MFVFLIIIHLLVCLGLISVVLLQSGKGGGLAGGAFGGSAQTVFGGRGATDFVTRATMVLGALVFLTSLTLALISSGVGAQRRSLMSEEARRAAASAPQAPGGPPRPQGQSVVPQRTGAPATGAQPVAPPPAGGTRPATPGGGK